MAASVHKAAYVLARWPQSEHGHTDTVIWLTYTVSAYYTVLAHSTGPLWTLGTISALYTTSLVTLIPTNWVAQWIGYCWQVTFLTLIWCTACPSKMLAWGWCRTVNCWCCGHGSPSPAPHCHRGKEQNTHLGKEIRACCSVWRQSFNILSQYGHGLTVFL